MQLAKSHRPCIDAATKQHLQRQCKRAAKELALSCPSAACLIQRQCKRAAKELALSCPSAACLIQRLCEASAMARRGNAVLPDLTLPSRTLSYTKTMRGERNGKTRKRSFIGLDTAEPKLVLYKDNANERNESLLLHFRVQLVLYKDK